MLTFILPFLAAVVLSAPPAGADIYATHCASCHGAQQRGSPEGPSLRHVGGATLDFYLATGRMPAETPWVEIAHRDERAGQQLPLQQIRALERYLAPVVAGGPALPQVVAGGDADRGRQLYAANCQQCHATLGDGGSIGRADWAPALHEATIDEVADAVRAGPGQMPRFGEHQFTQADLDDVAAFVMSLNGRQPGAGGLPLRSTGPVPEGALGYLAMIVLVTFAFVLWRRDRGETEGRKR